MKAVELINRAYNLSGIVSRGLSQVEGSEGKDGLFWLNQILAEKSGTGDYLPYYSRFNFFAQVGNPEYLIEGMATLDTLAFFIGATRYSLRGEHRRNFFGSARQENIDSLPFQYYYEKANGGIKVFLYFHPNSEYRFEAVGLASLPEVTNDTELDDSLDKFYQLFLMYELAEYLCIFNQITLPPQAQIKLNQMRRDMYNLNPKDVTINKQSLLASGPIMTYAQINIGKGWVPTS